MNSEFQGCLKRKKIQDFSRGKSLVEKELKTAEQDLLSAKTSFGNKNYKWTTVQSYYAMFHCARALLYSKLPGKKPSLFNYCLKILVC